MDFTFQSISHHFGEELLEQTRSKLKSDYRRFLKPILAAMIVFAAIIFIVKKVNVWPFSRGSIQLLSPSQRFWADSHNVFIWDEKRIFVERIQKQSTVAESFFGQTTFLSSGAGLVEIHRYGDNYNVFVRIWQRNQDKIEPSSVIELPLK